MPLLEALGKLADFLVRTIWIILRAIGRSATGIKRLLSAMHRLRTRGSGGATATARLFDVHAVSAAGDTALLVGLFFAPVVLTGGAVTVVVAGSLVLAIAASVAGAYLPGAIRAVTGLALVLRGLVAVATAQWFVDSRLLMLVMLGLILPQWAVHLTGLVQTRPDDLARAPMLARATGYALLGSLLIAVPVLILGWLAPTGPLWLAAGLFTLAALLALRLPAPGPQPVLDEPVDRPPGSDTLVPDKPGPGKSGRGKPGSPTLPAQPGPNDAPEGFHVYRPSTLDDPGA